MKYFDEHWAAVAEAYWQGGAKPGPYVAEQWGVPVTTAHRWFRTCRALGLLERRPSCVELVAQEVGVDPRDLHAAIQKHAKGWKVGDSPEYGSGRPRRVITPLRVSG